MKKFIIALATAVLASTTAVAEQVNWVWDDGTSYVGNAVDGEMMGDGVFTDTNGTSYNGVWVKSEMIRGTISFITGESHTGFFKNYKLDGLGTKVNPDGSVWRAEYESGVINGFFRYTDTNGNIMVGIAEDNVITGKANWQYSDGGIKTGDFVDGTMHGKGYVTHSDGERYEGDITNDEFGGEGRWTGHDFVSEGTFANGKLNGYSEVAWTDGTIYKGNMVNGVPNGYGDITYHDGSTYSGQFVDGDPVSPKGGRMVFPLIGLGRLLR